MSEFVITGYDAQRRPIYAEDLTEEEKTTAVESSPEWKKFSEKFVVNDTTRYLWKLAQIDKIGVDSSVDDSLKLLRDILRSGGIISLRTIKSETGKVLLDAGQYEFEIRLAEPEPQPEPEVPRDHTGKPLTSSQLEWRNFAIWANDPNTTSEMIRQRRLTDRSFAEFYRRSLEREATETPSTQFRLAGQSQTENKKSVAPELVTWAEEFRRTPMDRVRQQRSPVMNPFGFEAYENNLKAAIAAGLVGR